MLSNDHHQHQGFMLLLLLTTTSVVVHAGCTVCPDGAPVSRPDKVVNIPGVPQLDCRTADSVVPELFPDMNSAECTFINHLSTLCGCQRDEGGCSLCPDGSDAPAGDIPLPMFDTLFGGSTPSCELMEAYLHSIPGDNELCPYSQTVASEVCGCPSSNTETTMNTTDIPDNIFSHDSGFNPLAQDTIDLSSLGLHYFGVTNSEERIRQNSISRAAAIMSIVAALLVMLDNRDSNRLKNVYNQIVVVMAAFDVVSGVAYALLDIPQPTDDAIQTAGEKGNDATCIVQGWSLQLGSMTSLFLNASLSTYYMLVVVYSCRESRLKQLRKWMLGGPIVLGLVIAFASIPFIAPSIHSCYLVPPNASYFAELDIMGYTTSWAPFLALVIIPGYLVIAYATGVLVRVYWYVRRIDLRARRWNINHQAQAPQKRNTTLPLDGNSSSSFSMMKRRRSSLSIPKAPPSAMEKLRNEVFHQSAYYLIALYMTWFVTLCYTINMGKLLHSHYEFWSFVFFLHPLQGFLNACVYFRKRFVKFIVKSLQHCKEHRKQWMHCCCIRRKRRETIECPQSDNADHILPIRRSGWIPSFPIVSTASSPVEEPAVDIIEMNEAARLPSSILDYTVDDTHCDVVSSRSSRPLLEEPAAAIAANAVDMKEARSSAPRLISLDGAANSVLPFCSSSSQLGAVGKINDALGSDAVVAVLCRMEAPLDTDICTKGIDVLLTNGAIKASREMHDPEVGQQGEENEHKGVTLSCL